MRMLEKQAAWKREGDFDRDEITVERHQRTLRHLYAGYDPEPFHIEIHYDTRRLPTPEECTQGMEAEVDRLRLKLLLSQPPQLLPRITSATTAATVFCFQGDNRYGQNGGRSATNCCRRLFARRRYEELKARGTAIYF